jgi:methylenetetrahydrofolate dehydrogenase (NADP+)/methenyltetrahydrofolate cyclohydrolase
MTPARLKHEIRRLNDDPAVTGIMMHLPLPAHLDAPRLQYEIDPVKDVEGVNPANIGYVVYGHTLIAPCTALAVIELIKSTGVPSAAPRRSSSAPARSPASRSPCC